MIIAIDFDDTITEPSPYPITGKVRKDAIKYITKLYLDGHKLILWTCREGKYLNEALQILDDCELLYKFDKINDNVDGKTSSRKIFADYYIDDKSMKINWRKIYNQISGKGFWKTVNDTLSKIDIQELLFIRGNRW